MTWPVPLGAFQGYGIELEYMIVDRQTLSVLPIADQLLQQSAGNPVSEVKRGSFAWSNELVLHLIELKNVRPEPALSSLPAAFQAEVRQLNRLLDPMGARLMPTAMHPWMDPFTETRLWPHDNAVIYRTYDRVFDCRRGHGWANLQSMHLNLPFADDEEFARLHAAIRLMLPIIPAIAASSPIAEGRDTGFMDFRMEAYRTNALKIPSVVGLVVPETVTSRAEYEAQILAPMYRDIAPFDPDRALHHEWLNARGEIPRFDRNAIEIRVIDLQECPQSDVALAAAITVVTKAIYDETWAPLLVQQQATTSALTEIMLACIREADQAVISDAAYLQQLGYPGRRCEARELWRHLLGTLPDTPAASKELWQQPLQVVLDQGPLARRIRDAIAPNEGRARLHAVYEELCDCLEAGRMFRGLD